MQEVEKLQLIVIGAALGITLPLIALVKGGYADAKRTPAESAPAQTEERPDREATCPSRQGAAEAEDCPPTQEPGEADRSRWPHPDAWEAAAPAQR